MNDHIIVNSIVAVGDCLRSIAHPGETYVVEALEPGIAGVVLDRVRLRQIRKPGARRRAKTDLIAHAHLDEAYERVVVGR